MIEESWRASLNYVFTLSTAIQGTFDGLMSSFDASYLAIHAVFAHIFGFWDGITSTFGSAYTHIVDGIVGTYHSTIHAISTVIDASIEQSRLFFTNMYSSAWNAMYDVVLIPCSGAIEKISDGLLESVSQFGLHLHLHRLEPIYEWGADQFHHTVHVYREDSIAHVCFILLAGLLVVVIYLSLKSICDNRQNGKISFQKAILQQLCFMPTMITTPTILDMSSQSMVSFQPPIDQTLSGSVSEGIAQGEFMVLQNIGQKSNVDLDLGITIAKANDKQTTMRLTSGQSGLYIWTGTFWLSITSGFRILKS